MSCRGQACCACSREEHLWLGAHPPHLATCSALPLTLPTLPSPATLAEPVGRILFAGEATSNKPATVLGAYLSGLREAARLAGLAKPQAAD